jgi:hypothetical protein
MAVVRPEAVIGVFLLSGLAFWLVGVDEDSPLFVDSGRGLLGLVLLWWSLGWVMKRAGAPLFGKAWLIGSGAFVAAALGSVVLIVVTSELRGQADLTAPPCETPHAVRASSCGVLR